ncbi:MAG: aminotransferase class IV [Rubrobacteraceae bacterium]
MNLVYLNGAYLPTEKACLSVADRGLAYGDGLFTTIRISGGNPRFLDWHLERLLRDAAALYIAAPPVEELEKACWGLISRLYLEEGVVKITVTRGAGGRGPSPRNTGDPTLLVTASGLPEPRPPLRAITVPDGRGPLAAHKTLNYLPNILALSQAEVAGCDEALFVRDGRLVEATISNLVGVVDGEPRTPPQDGTVLGGVARRALLQAGAIQEGELPSGRVEPLYCVNNVRGVEAVAELDGRTIGPDPGLHQRLDLTLETLSRAPVAD